ncbi:XRE family transcriptional regulator, partial [Butyricicoccus sp. 1XD8-22]
QIERGQASPSLETLWKISTILEVPIFRFLRESFDEKIKVLRSEENEEIKILHPNVRYKMLIPNPLKKIDVMELLVEPNSEFIPPELSHNGDEFG